MTLPKINLPASRDVRMTNAGTKQSPLWVAAGEPTAIADMIRAGGGWVLTRQGPRAVLVDHVVKYDGALAIVPAEPTFPDKSDVTVRTVDNMTTDEIAAILAARTAGTGNGSTVKSNGSTRKSTTARKSNGSTRKASPQPAPVADVPDVTADTATSDVSDAELAALMDA